MAFMGTIHVTSGIGCPIHSHISLYADGKLQQAAEELAAVLRDKLFSRGYDPSAYRASARFSQDDGISYSEKEPHIGTVAHEEWHQLLYDAGCVNEANSDLVSIIEESSAEAVGDYADVKSASSEREKWVEEKYLSMKFNYARKVIKLYESVMNGDVQDGMTLESMMSELNSECPFVVQGTNWTTLNRRIDDLGMLIPCYAILMSEGIYSLKETVMKAIELATEQNDVNAGCEYIFSRVPEDAGLDIPKSKFRDIYEKMKLKTSFESDDFRLKVWSSEDDIPVIVSETLSLFEGILPKLHT